MPLLKLRKQFYNVSRLHRLIFLSGYICFALSKTLLACLFSFLYFFFFLCVFLFFLITLPDSILSSCVSEGLGPFMSRWNFYSLGSTVLDIIYTESWDFMVHIIAIEHPTAEISQKGFQVLFLSLGNWGTFLIEIQIRKINNNKPQIFKVKHKIKIIQENLFKIVSEKSILLILLYSPCE